MKSGFKICIKSGNQPQTVQRKLGITLEKLMKEKDWLNNFFEKNAWPILVALISSIVIFTVIRSQVKANTDNIKTLDDAVVQMIIIQNDIIKLQTNQNNMVSDIEEIKTDVKILILR